MVKHITNDDGRKFGATPYSVFYRGIRKHGYTPAPLDERLARRIAQENKLQKAKSNPPKPRKPKRKRRTLRIP